MRNTYIQPIIVLIIAYISYIFKYYLGEITRSKKIEPVVAQVHFESSLSYTRSGTTL